MFMVVRGRLLTVGLKYLHATDLYKELNKNSVLNYNMAILQRKDWRKRRRNLPKHTCPARQAVSPLRDLPAQTLWPQNALPHRDSSL